MLTYDNYPLDRIGQYKQNMFTLAIETATVPGGVAIADASRVVASQDFAPRQRSVQWLAPTIRRLLEESQVSKKDISGVAVLAGPGSFTGLRIGITTAKMLAYALGCRVAALNTLDVIASRVTDSRCQTLDVVLGAQRSQMFVRSYQRASQLASESKKGSHPKWEPLSDVEIRDQSVWSADLDERVAVSGPGLERVPPDLLGDAHVVSQELWWPDGWSLSCVAQDRWNEFGSDDIWSLTPNYFRKSYAE